MASFKDVLIKDVRSENARNLQFQHPSLEMKGHQDFQSSRVELSSTEDEIPDIEESRFRNVRGLKIFSLLVK